MTFISLGEFERRHGVNKGSVSRKAKELGFSTASGLDAEAYAAMLEAFDIDTTEASPAPSVVEVQATDSSSALAYYGGVSGGETSIISLGGVESRLAGREHHRQAIGTSFQNVFHHNLSHRRSPVSADKTAVLKVQTPPAQNNCVNAKTIEQPDIC